MDLILASQSPRREELIRKLGFDFKIVPATVQEIDSNIINRRISLINADLKAFEVAKRFSNALVIGADTVIEFQNECLGKPLDTNDAKKMLLRLSGSKHSVITAISLRSINSSIRSLFSVTTYVNFKRFSQDTVNKYISIVNTLDKAGSYAIQEHGDLLIESINGPKDNVIGLPCKKLQETLYSCNKNLELKN